MKNKYLLSLLAALGFSGCSNNNVWDEPCYYGPGPDWTPDVKLTTQVQNEDEDTINGIRVVASYKNQNDSLITDTAYTESRDRQLHGKRHSNQYTKIQRVPSQKQ